MGEGCAEPGVVRRRTTKEKGRYFRIGLHLEFFGSPTWARTRDLRINSPALYQLSYRGTAEKEIITSFSSFRQQLFNVLFSSEVVAVTLVRLETGLQWAFPPFAALPCSTARPHYSQLFKLCKQKNRPKAIFLRWPSTGQSNTGDSTPSTLCSFGEVVVYCMWIFLSGKMYGAAPNAASAASWKPDRISFFLPG